jgi:DNA-binding HxlR family transcriptional regulator
MQRKSFLKATCPVARGLERVGEWWSILIIRECFHGSTRFDQFQQALGIAPNMLARRLSGLVDAGMLEKRLYSERPPRHEYVLTERGRDFKGVLVALHAWGNRHFTPEGQSVMLVNARTGKPADPVLVDRNSKHPLEETEFRLAPGPAAAERTHRRLAASAWGMRVAKSPARPGSRKIRRLA